MFTIYYKREVIDTASSRDEAIYLTGEYNLAFNGGCYYRKK